MITEMSSKSQLLDTIAVRASFPLERLHHQAKGYARTDEPGWRESLQHLYDVVQATDEEKQARFLAHLTIDEQQMIQALSLPASTEQVTGSSWITLLDHIVSTDREKLLQEEATVQDRTFFPKAPRPFEELFLPFIQYARQQIQNLVPDYASLLSDRAQIQLEYWLLCQLTVLAGEPLVLEFMDFCSSEDEASILDEQKPRVLYDRFLSQYIGEGLLAFFAEYSVLARLLILFVEQWIEVCAELLERFRDDSDLIAHTFFENHSPGQVVNIQTGRSDRHNGGRTVLLLTFANNRKLAYKPRCMDIDAAFFQCIEWLNEKGISPDLKCGRVLNRKTYGWMEYIEHAACTTFTEVHSYYQRCGLLICLFYVLGSTDMHYENLIAQGAYPVPIDLETILSPSLTNLLSSSSTEESPLTCSVRRAGMLMSRMKVQDQAIDISVLGDVQVFPSAFPSLVWKNINTDAMTCSYEYENVTVPNDNKVIIAGGIEKSSGYIEDLVIGFRHMYHFLMEHSEEILGDGALLDFFTNCPIRYVFRGTTLYVKHLLRLAGNEFLQDGTSSWIVSQIFKRLLLKEQADHRLWSIVSAELVALERRDVPCFVTWTDSTDMYADEGIIVEKVFVRSALEQARSCIAELCDEDLERQIQLIYESYIIPEEPMREPSSSNSPND